jgi:hypothetical protein
MSSFPIIHMIGLRGAGKTTLAKKLSSRLNLIKSKDSHLRPHRMSFRFSTLIIDPLPFSGALVAGRGETQPGSLLAGGRHIPDTRS